jgi:hypothetical protein
MITLVWVWLGVVLGVPVLVGVVSWRGGDDE